MLGGETKRDISPESAARAGHRCRACVHTCHDTLLPSSTALLVARSDSFVLRRRLDAARVIALFAIMPRGSCCIVLANIAIELMTAEPLFS
jgi:hypothetical protein